MVRQTKKPNMPRLGLKRPMSWSTSGLTRVLSVVLALHEYVGARDAVHDIEMEEEPLLG